MLRAYQQEMKEAVKAEWAAGVNNIIGVLPTGAGKTVTMAHLAKDFEHVAGVAIAHRSVLIGQISMALARVGIRHDIVAQKSVIRTIVEEHMEELGRSWYSPSSDWKVASVDTLPGRADRLASWINRVRVGITDECFPAGTLIDGKPIESIRVGDVVTAFDENSGQFQKRAVTRLFKNPMPANLVEVRTAHHMLRSTNGHPFWTQRGWVDAAELQPGDMVLANGNDVYGMRHEICDSKRGAAVSDAKDRQGVLHEDLWLSEQRQEPQAEVDATGAAHLCQLWQTFRCYRLQANLRDTFMQQGMFFGTKVENLVRSDGCNKSQVRIGKDASEEPNARRSYQIEDGVNSSRDRTPTIDPRWQWAPSDNAGADVAGSSCERRLRLAIRSTDREVAGFPVSLQVGLGAPCAEGLRRSGWGIAPIACSQGAGRTQREIFGWTRVESVSFHQPTSDDGDFVYNIEVEGLHTYVANGVVVHNCHHVLLDNKWGRECMRFRNAQWFLPTATPKRGDRKGLGRHADGIADKIIEGPSMQWHIDNGYLTNFLIRAPMPADLDLSDVEVSSGGEYNQKQLRKAVHRSNKIIGNVVETYRKFTPGMLGIVFAVDIEHAKKLCEGFVGTGVPAEIITAEHTEEQRREILKRYRERKTLVLVNVDLFGEGFDLPAIEVVMFARPTASYSLYAQQFGRGLRLMIDKQYQQHWESYSPEQRRAIIAASSKPVAHIHDHVGNIVHFYGPPTKPQKWTLDREAARKTGPSDAIPLRVCLNDGCLQPYERSYPACPYCGMEPKPAAPPKLPIEVDGDLTLYTPEMLSRLFGVSSVDEALAIKPSDFCAVPPGASVATQRALQANHQRKHLEQQKLAGLMSLVMPPLHDDRVNQRRFFLRYGIDVVAARMLGAADTERLNEKLLDTLVKTSND